MSKLLIFTDKTSNRLTYIFDFILGELLGLEYELTSDTKKFASNRSPKFSYAAQAVSNEIFFESAPLLFETDVRVQPLDYCEYESLIGFYLVSKDSRMPFDPFASAFFMMVCYNEYMLSKKDKYDRYRASQSLNYKAGFLDKPMINYYALELKKILSTRYPSLEFKQNKFQYTPTFDIDMAFSYQEKGAITNTAGFLRGLLLSDFRDIRNRYGVLFRGKKDPFDTFDYIFRVCDKHALKSIFFFLVGDKSRFDKNISVDSPLFRKLIQDIAARTEIGIHLSFRSHVANDIMRSEIDRLEEITGKKITQNRFHFLRFSIPASYIRLVKLGLQEDYSLGHASRIGFRAGTCSPFYFFNLVKNESTNFRIHPFAFMDATLTHYNRLSPTKALERILQIMKYVKEVEGPFIGLWHNSSFTEEKEWKGWRNIFETVADEAAELMKTP